MTVVDDQVEALVSQITALPDEAQAKLTRALLDIHAEQLGIFASDDDEPARCYEGAA